LGVAKIAKSKNLPFRAARKALTAFFAGAIKGYPAYLRGAKLRGIPNRFISEPD